MSNPTIRCPGLGHPLEIVTTRTFEITRQGIGSGEIRPSEIPRESMTQADPPAKDRLVATIKHNPKKRIEAQPMM